MVPGHSGEVRRAGAGAVLLRRLAGREDAVQIRGASAIKSCGWAADVEACAGGGTEGAYKGANPIDPGTQAASETPGEMLEATVPRMRVQAGAPWPKGIDEAASTSSKFWLPRQVPVKQVLPVAWGFGDSLWLLFG